MKANEIEFKLLDGSTISLGSMSATAFLIVNTASECGYTKQYEAMQDLYRQWMGKGLVVLAIPSNDFGAQEPGDDEKIGQFCRRKYSVNFPISTKEEVIGPDAHEFYKWVSAELGEDHLPKWNFHKYLLNKKGELVGAWPSRVSPTDDDIVSAIKSLLS